MIPKLDTIHHGDVLEVLRSWPDAFVDAVVTDPPYGLEFMGKEWDGSNGFRRSLNKNDAGRENVFGRNSRTSPEYKAGELFEEWTRSWAEEVFRVMKPGAHLVSFASTRTYHRMGSGVEDAGFEIRDQIGWLFGSGFPKSKNLKDNWKGWGTALKPGWEPIVLARKPLEGTVEENVKKWGTGALNIDGCRVETNGETPRGSGNGSKNLILGQVSTSRGNGGNTTPAGGRWPANVAHDGSDDVLDAFPDAPGQQGYTGPEFGNKKTVHCFGDFGPIKAAHPRGDIGSAARFFYCAKASRSDREEHLNGMPTKPLNWSSGEQSPGTFQSPDTERNVQNHHPTVKPTDLMRWLCRLVTPPGGLILDPFFGSGSTGKAAIREGFHWLGIEKEEEYIKIAERRIAGELAQGKMF